MKVFVFCFLLLGVIVVLLVGCVDQFLYVVQFSQVLCEELQVQCSVVFGLVVLVFVLVVEVCFVFLLLVLLFELCFDFIVNGVLVCDVFFFFVVDICYSMFVYLVVLGLLLVMFKGVMLCELFDVICEVYGFDYVIDGCCIIVFLLMLQICVYFINVLVLQCSGCSEVCVSFGVVFVGSQNGGIGGMVLSVGGSGIIVL